MENTRNNKKYEYVRKTFTWEGKRYDVKGKTIEEVYKKIAKMKVSLERGEIVINANTTVDHWFKEWVETYKNAAGLTPKSLKMYDEKYRNYIQPVIGAMKLRDVREIHLQKILNDQAGRSYSHVSKIRLVLKEMFSRARKTRIITFDPAEDLKLPATQKNSHRAITETERAAILSLAPSHRSGLWVLMMLYAGLRPGETVALNWADIDFERNEIHVHKAVESGSERIKETKTEAGNRDVPMHADLKYHLLRVQGKPESPVFQTGAGNRHNHKSLQRLWNSFARDLDIKLGAELRRNQIIKHAIAPDLTPYCLRHTFCTDLQKAGVPINIAKELMGHSDISVTANIYTHKDPGTLHANIEKLAASQVCSTASAWNDFIVLFSVLPDLNFPGFILSSSTFSGGISETIHVENTVEKNEMLA